MPVYYTPEEWDKVSRDAYEVYGGDHAFNGEENEGTLGDIGTSLKIGGVSLGRQAAGLADVVTGGLASQALNPWFDRKEREFRNEYSPELQMREAAHAQRVEEARQAGGEPAAAWEAFMGTISDPRLLGARTGESLPSTLTGLIPGVAAARSVRGATAVAGAAKDAVAGATKSALKGKAVMDAARLGGALGEGALGAGGTVNQIVAENTEAGRDPMYGAWSAAPVGAGTAATALAFGKFLPGANKEAALASSLAGRKIAEPLIAQNSKPQTLLKKAWSSAKDYAKTGIQEGAEEGTQAVSETIFPNIAMGRPVTEGLGQNIGESAAVGGAMGVGMHAATRGVEGAQRFQQGPRVEDQRGAISPEKAVAVNQAAAETLLNGTAIPNTNSSDPRLQLALRTRELATAYKNAQTPEEQQQILAELAQIQKQAEGFNLQQPTQPPTTPVYASPSARNAAVQQRLAVLNERLQNAQSEEEARAIQAEIGMLEAAQRQADQQPTQPPQAIQTGQPSQTAQPTQPTQGKEDLNSEEGVLDAMEATRKAYRVAKTPEEQEALSSHYNDLSHRLEEVRANTKEEPSPYADDDMSVEAITYRSQRRAKQTRLAERRKKHEEADTPFRAKVTANTAKHNEAGTAKKVNGAFRRATSPDSFSGSMEGRKLDNEAISAFAAVEHPEKETVAAAMDEAEARGTRLGEKRPFQGGNSSGLVRATVAVLNQATEKNLKPVEVLNNKAEEGIIADSKATKAQARIYKRAALRLENPNDSDSDITKKAEDWESAIRKKQEESAPKPEAKPKAKGKKEDPIKAEQHWIKDEGGFNDYPTPEQATMLHSQRDTYGGELVDSAIKAVKTGIKKGVAEVSKVTIKLIDRYTTDMHERKANGKNLSTLGFWITNDKRSELKSLADKVGVSTTQLALIGQVLPQGDAAFDEKGRIVQTSSLDKPAPTPPKAETKPAPKTNKPTPPKSETVPKAETKPPRIALESDEDANDIESMLSPILFGTDYDYQREYGKAETDVGVPKSYTTTIKKGQYAGEVVQVKYDPREQRERNYVKLTDRLFIARMLGGSPYARKLSKRERQALDALRDKRERKIERARRQIERLQQDYSKTAAERRDAVNAKVEKLRKKASEENELESGLAESGLQFTSGYRMATETPDIVRRCQETHDFIMQKIGLALTNAGAEVKVDENTVKYILPSDLRPLLAELHNSGRLEAFKEELNEAQAEILKEIVMHFRAMLNKNLSGESWATVGLELSSSMLDTYAGAMQMIGVEYDKTQIGRLLGALALANAGKHFSIKIDENAEGSAGVRELTGRITMPALPASSTDEEVRSEEDGVRKEVEDAAEEQEEAESDGEGAVSKNGENDADPEVGSEKAAKIMARGMRAQTVDILSQLKTDTQIENFFMKSTATSKEVDEADASIGENIIPKDLDGLTQEEWAKVGLDAEQQTNQEFFSTLPRSGRKPRARTAAAFRQFVRKYVAGEFGASGKKIAREGDFTSQLPEEVPPILIRTSLFPAILKPGEMRRWVRNIRKAVGVFKKDWKTGNIISYREKIPSPLGNEINVLSIVNNILKDNAISDFYKENQRYRKPLIKQPKFLPYINGLISVKRVIRYELSTAIRRDIKRFAEAYRRNIAELMNLYENPAEAWRTACQLQYDVEQVLDILTDKNGKKEGALPGLSPADRAKVDAQIAEIMHLAQVKLNVLDMANKPISTNHVKERPKQLDSITFTTRIRRKKQKALTAEDLKEAQEKEEKARAERAVKEFNAEWHKEFLARARESFPNTVALAEARAAAGKADLMADSLEQYERGMEKLPNKETRGLAKEVTQYMDEFAKLAASTAMGEKVGLNDTAYVNWVIESVLGTEENPNGCIINKRINTAEKARKRCESIRAGYIGRAGLAKLAPINQIKAMQYHYVAERLKSPLTPPDKLIKDVQTWARKTGKIEKEVYSSLGKAPAVKNQAKAKVKAEPKAEVKSEPKVEAKKEEAPAKVAEAPKPVEAPTPASKPVEKKAEPRYKEGKPITKAERQKAASLLGPEAKDISQRNLKTMDAIEWQYGAFEETNEASFDSIRNSDADPRAIDAAIYLAGLNGCVALPLDTAVKILRENNYASSCLVGVFSKETAYVLAEGVEMFDRFGWQIPSNIIVADTIRSAYNLDIQNPRRGEFSRTFFPSRKGKKVTKGIRIKDGSSFSSNAVNGVISLGVRPLALHPHLETLKGMSDVNVAADLYKKTGFHELLHAAIAENNMSLGEEVGMVFWKAGNGYDTFHLTGAARSKELEKTVGGCILKACARHALDAYRLTENRIYGASFDAYEEANSTGKTQEAEFKKLTGWDLAYARRFIPQESMGDEFFTSLFPYWVDNVAGIREVLSKEEWWDKLAPIFEGVNKYVRSVHETNGTLDDAGNAMGIQIFSRGNGTEPPLDGDNDESMPSIRRGELRISHQASQNFAKPDATLPSASEAGNTQATDGARGSATISSNSAEGSSGGSVGRGSSPTVSGSGQRTSTVVLQQGGGRSSLPPQGDRGSSGEQKASRRLDSAARDKIIESVPQKFRPLARTVLGSITDGAFRFMFSRNFVEEFKNLLPSISKWWSGVEKLMQTRAQWQQKAADIADRFTKLSKHEQAAFNKIAISSTLNDFWPERDKEVFPTQASWDAYVDGIMSSDSAEDYKLFLKQYRSLSEEGRKLLRAVLDVGTQEKKELTRIKIEDAHETILRQMRGATPQRKQELEDQLTREVNEINRDLERAIHHPYVPLGRKGTHVVAYRSKEYLNTEKAIKDFQEKLREANRAPTKAEEATLQDLKDSLDKMASDNNHYVVEFFEDRYDANKRYEDLKLQYPNLEKESIQVFDRAIFLGEKAPEWASSRKLLEQLTKEKEAENGTGSLREKDIDRMSDILQELFVKALPDVSARKMQLRRRGVSGYNENAMENFVQHANASSHLIASLTHSQEIHDALEAMGDEARQQAAAGLRDEASIIANEVRRRQNQIFSGKAEDKTIGKIMRATSVWMLLTNPAFYLQNILQPGMMSAPYINGELGINCIGELVGVMKRVAQFVTKDKSLQSLCETLSKNEQEAIMRARDHQLLTIGITTDLGTVSNDTRYGRVTNWMTQKAQTVEVVNRVSTYLVAYRNAIKKGMTHEEAMEFAERVIVQTHGDYSKENAPSIMNENGFTRMASQFRKFQFIQTGMVYRMLRDSARKDLSPAERAIARRQLMWIMGTHFAAAGLKGTPVLAQIAALSAFVFGGAGDDDEDLIREAVGDKDVADLLLKGIPMLMGFDLSKKVGAGDMLNPLPFFDYDVRKGKRNMGEFAVNAAGPWASIPAKMAEGITYLANGEYSKGIEQILPYGIASNLMKATRLQTEGYTNRTGDVLIQPENMDWVDWIYTGMGLTPRQMSRRTYLQGWALRHDAVFSEMKSDIQRDYDEAKRNHDYKGMVAAKKKLGELNRERTAAGYTPIKPTQLDSAYKQKVKREKNAVGGVVTSNQNRAGLTRQSQW